MVKDDMQKTTWMQRCDRLKAAAAVTHTRAAHGDRTDAGHDLTLGQMPRGAPAAGGHR